MRHAKTNFTPVAWLSIPYDYTVTKTGLTFKPGFQFFSLKIQIILLFISFEIDCFHSQWTANICTAGLNRWAATLLFMVFSQNEIDINVHHANIQRT